jgi:DNA polymerase-3 subunit delta'
MEIFKDLIGNEDIKNSLGIAIQEKRFSHAYIIEGAYGTGKRTVSRLAAASILCQKSGEALPCGKCDACRKVLNDSCADVRVLEITKVDDARELRSTLYESSSEYDYKIYIIENAEKMNIKAQNALLISLEEPPKNVVFFLLTQDASALLETIRSRAQILRTKPLSRETIFSYIKENASLQISDERLMEIVVSSAGSLGYALDMLDTKKSDEVLALRDLSLELVSSVLKNNADSVTFMFSLFGKTRDELKEILSLSTTVIGDVILLKKDTNVPLYFFSSADSGLALGEGHSVQRLLAIYDALLDAKDALNSNSNVATTLMSILLSSKKKGN